MPSVWSARGGLVYKGRYKAKYQSFVKLWFESLNIVWDDFWPQNRIPGKILILLDTQDLSIRQKLPKSDIAKNGNWPWQMANMAMSDLGNFWRTDKSWVSKSIRILPGIRFWGQKSSQTMLRVWKWRFTQVWYFPLYPPLVNQPTRARGVEDYQKLFLCVKPSSYMYRQTYQKQGLILESYRILGWTNIYNIVLKVFFGIFFKY